MQQQQLPTTVNRSPPNGEKEPQLQLLPSVNWHLLDGEKATYHFVHEQQQPIHVVIWLPLNVEEEMDHLV